MADLTQLTEQARSLAKDHSEHLATSDWEFGILEALSVYNRDIPRRVVEDKDGDGSIFDFELGSAFDPGYSTISTVEYPADQRHPRVLEASDWILYQKPDGPVLRLLHFTPGPTETVRVTYSVPHTVKDFNGATDTTIPGHHIGGIAALIASYALQRLANRFVHEQDATLLHADAVDRQSKSTLAQSRARELDAMYRRVVGVGRRLPAAGSTVDWDSQFAGQMDWLVRSNRWR